MSFNHDMFFDLPDDIRRMIVTQYLTGGSLCNCLRVCKGWYTYFKNFVWQDKVIGKCIRNELEHNWFEGVFEEKEEYIQLRAECVIGASAQNSLVLTSVENTPLENVEISVLNLYTDEMWSINNVFNSVLRTAKKNSYDIVLSNGIMAIRTELKGDSYSEQLLVWKLDGFKKVVDERVDNLYQFQVSCNENDQDILILHRDYLEVWDLSCDDQISKVQTTTMSVSPLTSVSYTSPFIIQSSVDPISDVRSVKVWKFTQTPFRLQKHLDIDDLDSFVHENGVRQAIQIGEVISFQDFFMICCRCPLLAGEVEIQSLSFKMISNDGNILRESFLPQCSVHADVTYFPFYGRLTVAIDGDVYIFKELQQYIGQSSEETQLVMKRMGALDGTSELFFRKKSCNSAQVLVFDDGACLLDIQSLDFWDNLNFQLKVDIDSDVIEKSTSL